MDINKTLNKIFPYVIRFVVIVYLLVLSQLVNVASILTFVSWTFTH